MNSSITVVVVTSAIVILGWFFVHYLTARRDHKNKKRELRLEYLIRAYRELGMAAARPANSEYLKNLESGFHDVQLFGNSEQLKLLEEIFLSHEKFGGANLEPLLNSLRTELRELLGQSTANTELKFYRTGN